MQRLAQLGYVTEADLRFWPGLWRSSGESFFWSFLRCGALAMARPEVPDGQPLLTDVTSKSVKACFTGC